MSQLQVKRDTIRNSEERRFIAPRVDVFENDREVLLIADLPGVAKEDLSVHVDADTLVLEGTRKSDLTAATLTREYEKLDYKRSFNLPAGIDREKIEAELVSGVLTLKLPKLAALQPKKIAIRAG
jgi:HSP20 family molecular chaperone IbpA